MKKSAVTLVVIAVLLASVPIATANPTPMVTYLTITSDGDIQPPTDLISREGNVYRLTGNVTEHAIKIQCSNIAFDGAGYYVIGVVDEEWAHPKWWPGNAGILLEQVDNVVVENVEVFRFGQGITLEGCTNCSLIRVDALYMVLQNSSYNLITESNICNGGHPLLMRDSVSNRIYKNNITLVDVIGANFWDNGSVGNYWGSYSGVDSDGDGVGDIPCIIVAPENIDNYPLMTPYIVKEIPPSTSPTRSAEVTEINNSASLAQIAAVTIAIVVICAGILLYTRKKKTPFS